MILVVDSGSSKSDWKLELPDSPPLSFSTNGLNPFFVNDKEITRVIKEIPEIIPSQPLKIQLQNFVDKTPEYHHLYLAPDFQNCSLEIR